MHGFAPVPSNLYLVSAKSALLIPRVRAVADLLSEELSRAKVLPKRTSTKR